MKKQKTEHQSPQANKLKKLLTDVYTNKIKNNIAIITKKRGNNKETTKEKPARKPVIFQRETTPSKEKILQNSLAQRTNKIEKYIYIKYTCSKTKKEYFITYKKRITKYCPIIIEETPSIAASGTAILSSQFSIHSSNINHTDVYCLWCDNKRVLHCPVCRNVHCADGSETSGKCLTGCNVSGIGKAGFNYTTTKITTNNFNLTAIKKGLL